MFLAMGWGRVRAVRHRANDHDAGSRSRGTRRWIITQLLFAAALIGSGAFAVANSSDRSPNQIGAAALCTLTWMIVPVTWVLAWMLRRQRFRRKEPQGFPVQLVSPIESGADSSPRKERGA